MAFRVLVWASLGAFFAPSVFAATLPTEQCMALLARAPSSGKLGRRFFLNTEKGLEIPLGEHQRREVTFVVPKLALPTSRGENGGVIGLRSRTSTTADRFEPLLTLPIPDEDQKLPLYLFDTKALEALGFAQDAAQLKLVVVFFDRVVTVDKRFEASVVALPVDMTERAFSNGRDRLVGANRDAAERRARHYIRLSRESFDTDLTDRVMRAWEDGLSEMD